MRSRGGRVDRAIYYSVSSVIGFPGGCPSVPSSHNSRIVAAQTEKRALQCFPARSGPNNISSLKFIGSSLRWKPRFCRIISLRYFSIHRFRGKNPESCGICPKKRRKRSLAFVRNRVIDELAFRSGLSRGFRGGTTRFRLKSHIIGKFSIQLKG